MCQAAERCELFLYDIKQMDAKKHRDFTGVSNELILSNLQKISRLGSQIRLRIPFIPGYTSDDENITAIAELAAALKGIQGVNILPYHKAAMDKHRRWGFNYQLGDLREPTEAELQHAREICAKKGLAVQIGG